MLIRNEGSAPGVYCVPCSRTPSRSSTTTRILNLFGIQCADKCSQTRYYRKLYPSRLLDVCVDSHSPIAANGCPGPKSCCRSNRSHWHTVQTFEVGLLSSRCSAAIYIETLRDLCDLETTSPTRWCHQPLRARSVPHGNEIGMGNIGVRLVVIVLIEIVL